VQATIQPLESETPQTAQRFIVSLGFADGSLATVLYTDHGAPGLSKEYLEVHAGGRSAILHDFRRLELYRGRSRTQIKARRQDKGHRAQFVHLRRQLADGSTESRLDPLDSMEVTLAALADLSRGRAENGNSKPTSNTNGDRDARA
jgi:hypothetical protein